MGSASRRKPVPWWPSRPKQENRWWQDGVRCGHVPDVPWPARRRGDSGQGLCSSVEYFSVRSCYLPPNDGSVSRQKSFPCTLFATITFPVYSGLPWQTFFEFKSSIEAGTNFIHVVFEGVQMTCTFGPSMSTSKLCTAICNCSIATSPKQSCPNRPPRCTTR